MDYRGVIQFGKVFRKKIVWLKIIVIIHGLVETMLNLHKIVYGR